MSNLTKHSGRIEKPLDQRRNVVVQSKITQIEKETLSKATGELKVTESELIRQALSVVLDPKLEVEFRGKPLVMNLSEALGLLRELTKEIHDVYRRK